DDPCLDLGSDRRVRVGFLDPEPPPHKIDEGMERHRAPEGQAVPFLPPRLATDAAAQLEQQARLADTRLADQEHHLSRARAGAREGVEEHAQLTLATHERSEAALRLDLQPRPRLVRAQHLPGGHRLRLALEVNLADSPRLEIAVDQTVSRF